MHIEDLNRYGVEQPLIDIWRESGHERLLPVQQIAVQRYGLFAGENLIVTAPTSSGKTFVGEMAAGHTIAGGGKCFYLVPLKALATEKFETFRQRYGPRGARVAISTRDYRQYDRAIEEQAFDLAVVVYEKMQQILMQTPRALQGIKLVVVDELQTLADAERGPDLEMLLTRMKLARARFQLVGLSAVLQNSDLLSRWLDARFLEHYERPVELRRGVIHEGQFHYETYNSRTQGVETLADTAQGDAADVMVANAVHLAGRGEQSLIFLSDKRSTRSMALRIAESLDQAPATDAMDELQAMEETRSREMLVDCLQSGVAFHNADMGVDERQVVERHFRQGAIRIICSTPTLAVGVNLPVRNVFLAPQIWDRDRRSGDVYRRFLTKAEHDNMGGRAGRLSLEQEFGRSILVATSPLEYQVLRNRFLEAELEGLEPRLGSVDLETHAMNLVAGGLARTEAEIARFLSNTLTGVMHQRALANGRKRFQEKIAGAVTQCVEYGLVRRAGARLQATSLGRLCAVKGIAAGTGHAIQSWLSSTSGRSFPEIEAIYALCLTAEAQDQHVNMSTQEYHSWVYPERLAAMLPRQAIAFFSPTICDRNYQCYEDVRAMKMALFLDEWVEGRRAIEIEDAFQSLAGTIRNAGEVCGWLADSAAAIAELLEFASEQVAFLENLTVRLVKGVPADGVPLCGANGDGLRRTQVLKLLQAGLSDPRALVSASSAALKRAIGAKMAEEVRRHFAKMQDSGQAKGAAGVPSTRADDHAGSPPTATDAFRPRIRLHFDGSHRGRRTELLVNGLRHDVPNKTFWVLLRLARQLHEDGAGWVERDAFAPSPQQVISNARKDLRGMMGEDAAKAIESDGLGSYRLGIAATDVTFDWASIRRHWNHEIAELAERPIETSVSGAHPRTAEIGG